MRNGKATDHKMVRLRANGDVQPCYLHTKEWDGDVGLYYFNARWYSRSTGRFLSRAPVPVEDEPPYTYVHNNPVYYVDPTGELIAWPLINPPPPPELRSCKNLEYCCMNPTRGAFRWLSDKAGIKHCWVRINGVGIEATRLAGRKWSPRFYNIRRKKPRTNANCVTMCCRSDSCKESTILVSRDLRVTHLTGIWTPLSDCSDRAESALKKGGCRVTRDQRRSLGIPRFQ